MGMSSFYGTLMPGLAHSQIIFYDASEEMLRELDVSDMGLTRHSQDEGHTDYGTYLTDMGTAHGLGHLEWPAEISSREWIHLFSSQTWG